MEARRGSSRLGRLPDALELRPRTHEPCRRVREIVVAGHREHGRSERAQQLRRAFELLPAPAVRKITRGHDELGLEPVDEPLQRALDVRLLMCICVEVGNMEEPGIHDRTRL